MADAVEVQTKPHHPIVVLRNYLDQRTNEIKNALPAHISPDRFIRIVMTAVQINPDLIACDRGSLWNACLRCANDGLLPDNTEAALVPIKNKVTYIPMVGGLLKRFRNSGEFKHINTGIVREGDTYRHYVDEDGEHFLHEEADDNSTRKVRRVYATAKTTNGGFFVASLTQSEIDKHKAMSRANRDDAPWKAYPEEMARKTALRVLSKYLPKSSDIDALLERDESALRGVEAVEDRRLAVAASNPTSGLAQFAQEDEEPQQVEAEPVEKTGDPIDFRVIGVAAHKQGVPRDRPPGELRSPDRADDLELWRSGWDSVG